jgi:DNA-binding LytR/AlgR family response regulator
MIKAVIIEDEPLVAKQLERKIRLVAGDIEVIEILPSLKTARRWFLANAEPDLLFMDVQLSDGTSFELFDFYQLSCPVIFTTAYDEYAIRAFKVNGIDYLLKPVGEPELQKAIDRCRNLLSSSIRGQADLQAMLQAISGKKAGQPPFKEKFIINIRSRWVPVETENVAYFVKDLFTFQGEKHPLEYDSMDELEEILDPRRFYRANRQFIINISAIASVQLHENQKLTVFMKKPLNIEIDISREKAPSFKKWFDR